MRDGLQMQSAAIGVPAQYSRATRHAKSESFDGVTSRGRKYCATPIRGQPRSYTPTAGSYHCGAHSRITLRQRSNMLRGICAVAVGSVMAVILLSSPLAASPHGFQAAMSGDEAMSRRHVAYSRVKRSCDGPTFTLETFIALVEKIERNLKSKSKDWDAETVSNHLRVIFANGTFFNYLCKRVVSSVWDGLPSGTLTLTEYDFLHGLISHGNSASGLEERGIVLTNNGDTLALGHVITGISCGGFRRDPYFFSDSVAGEMDSLFAMTLSGDLGQATLFHGNGITPGLIGPGGKWDNSACPKVYSLNGAISEATNAEMLADIDGVLIGLLIPGLKSKNIKLSQIFRQYYGVGLDPAGKFKDTNRIVNFKEAVSDVELKKQTHAFSVYYTAGKWSGTIWKKIKFWTPGAKDFLSLTPLKDIPKTINTFYGESFMKKCTGSLRNKYTIDYFTGLLKQAESDTKYDIGKMTDTILSLSKYFKSGRFDELMPDLHGKIDHGDGYVWYILREMIRHEVVGGKREIGLVRDSNNEALAIGHVLAGIHAALASSYDTEESIYKSTIAGNLAQHLVDISDSQKKHISLLGTSGKWDTSCPPKFILSKRVNPLLHLTRAEIIGDIDGVILGLRAKTSYSKLSTILAEYYSPTGLKVDKAVASKLRLQLFRSVDKKQLTTYTTAACKKLVPFYVSGSFCGGYAKDAVKQLFKHISETGVTSTYRSRFLPDFYSLVAVYPGSRTASSLRKTVVGDRVIASDSTTTSLLRLSYMLNKLDGHYVDKLPQPQGTIIGVDGKIYILDMDKLIQYLTERYGTPITSKSISDKVKQQAGIMVLKMTTGDVVGLWGGKEMHSIEDYSKRTSSIQDVYLWKVAKDCKWIADSGNCEFYRCVDTQFPCGPDGYALGYGYKYCNRFNKYLNNFNSEGRKWIETVRKCLMQAVLKYWASPSKTCETIKEFAFDSHPDCYVVPGKTDICSILFSDAKTLFTDVYDLADLFTMSGVQQMVITGGYCFKEVVNYVEKGVSSAVDAVLDLFDGLQVVARSGIDNKCVALAEQGNCAFYSCFEQRHPCKESVGERHVLEFALPSCRQHSTYSGLMNGKGRLWLSEAQKCIMNAFLVEYEKSSVKCAALPWFFFKNMAKCYKKAGFCDIIESPQNRFALERSMDCGSFPIAVDRNVIMRLDYDGSVYYHRMLRMQQRYIAPLARLCNKQRETLYRTVMTKDGLLLKLE